MSSGDGHVGRVVVDGRGDVTEHGSIENRPSPSGRCMASLRQYGEPVVLGDVMPCRGRFISPDGGCGGGESGSGGGSVAEIS